MYNILHRKNCLEWDRTTQVVVIIKTPTVVEMAQDKWRDATFLISS